MRDDGGTKEGRRRDKEGVKEGPKQGQRRDKGGVENILNR